MKGSINEKRPYAASVKKAIVFTFLSFLLVNAWAQVDASSVITQSFNAYHSRALREKLFVHTDKTVYLAGELLWFKLYDVDAFFHIPLAVSSVAYVELLDRNNKPALKAKISLDSGSGGGSIFLPVSLQSGNYKLRAYTNWMKNFGPDYFFEKPLTILNTQKAVDTVVEKPADRYEIGLFPEGGNLVNSLQSTLAFQINDQYGKGVDCEGKLIDLNGDTIQTLHTLKFGMGNFNFTPVSNHSYKAVFNLPGKDQLVKELPRAYDQGYVMHVLPVSATDIQVTVNARFGNNSEGGQTVFLFVHTRGSVKWAGSGNLQNSQLVFHIDPARLGDGISDLTLFNAEKKPVCERLYFKYPENKLRLDLHADQQEYACRKKVNIQIGSVNQTGEPRRADLSLAVYRIDSLQDLDDVNIENYLLLSSDLTGGIESPNYYFDEKNEEKLLSLDNLMLTHGWRRFAWDDILKNKKSAFTFTPEYDGHIITGKITDIRTGAPAKNINGYLSVPGLATQFRNAVSDEKGRIKFEMKNFFGSPEIIVQTNTLEDTNYRVDIASPFFDRYSAAPLPFFSMPDKKPVSLLYASIGTQVQNVFADEKTRQFGPPPVDTTVFYAEADEKYVLDDFTRFTTIEEIIREYVLAVNVTKRAGKFHLVVTNKFTRQQFSRDPLLLYDAVPVFDVDKFMNNQDPLKMYKLEVIEKEYFLGYQGFDGILNFTSYKGDLAGHELDPHAIALDYEGLQLQRKFYSPQYVTEQQIASHKPDFRSLLYWTSELKTNSSGKKEESFYTSDIPGKYAVVLQGIDPTGLMGSQVIFFEVKGK